ncbi:MAG: hypothetical protein Q8L14_34390 [Myxococcales bacterium]|nr:hypothetical protein [Myxococcales bacterium]
MTTPADLAIDALNRRNLREAMRSALVWWRRAPLPRLAELIVALEALTPEAERDGVSARLLTVIAGGNSVKSRATVEALGDGPADPRLTDFLIHLIGAPPFDVSAGNPEAFIRAVVELLLRQPDPRVLPWRNTLPAFLDAHRGSRRGQLSADEIATITRIVSSLPPSRPPKPNDDPQVDAFAQALEPLQRLQSSGTEARARLFADVVEHFDDARLQVYADFLSEQGEPQGELIARMMAGENDGLETLQRASRPRCFGSARLEWDRGLPIKALFADRDGIRSGTWGPELEWGTLREADVIPLDGCHAERLETLHVGATYVKDLARRTQPLSVKTLILGNVTEGTLAAWKKVSSLTSLERVVVTSVDDVEGLLGFLGTPTGQRVTSLEVKGAYVRALVLTGAAELFRASKRLETISVPALSLSRSGTLEVTLSNAANTRQLVKDLSQVKRPLCELVVLKGPDALTKDAALRSLGARVEVKTESSTLLTKATLTTAGGHLVLTPDAGVVFDASAVEVALTQQRPSTLELSGGVDFREAAALWTLALAAGVERLTLKRTHGEHHIERGPHQYWYFAPFTVTLSREHSSWELGAGAKELLPIAVAGLPRVTTATLYVAGALVDSLPQLTAMLRDHAAAVTVTTVDPASEWTPKFIKARKHLELRARMDAAVLRPSTLEALLALHPKTGSVTVFQQTIDVVPWLEWVRNRKLPLDFRLANSRPDGPIRLWWEDGLRVSLTLRHDLIRTLPAALFDVPARAIDHLELVHYEAIPSAWLEVAKHVAKKHTSRRP